MEYKLKVINHKNGSFLKIFACEDTLQIYQYNKAGEQTAHVASDDKLADVIENMRQNPYFEVLPQES